MPENELYRQVPANPPQETKRWHLYGAGLENVGKNGKPEIVPLQELGADEILVRHDAVGICYSDIKIVNLGAEHPRLVGRNLVENPVVMGHEVALTIVQVGTNLVQQFHPGERFIVQADVYYKGQNLAYGYAITGGMAQFGIIGPEVLQGDEGCYLLPIEDKTGYAEAALVEPWACVEAAYHWTQNALDAVGESVAIGDTHEPIPSPTTEGFSFVDFVGAVTAEQFANACTKLRKNGIVRLSAETKQPFVVSVDVGRVHYNGWLFIGPEENKRNELKKDGVAWFIGAAGPMGQMHVQRALQLPSPPAKIICTDRNDNRLAALEARLGAMAKERGVEMVYINVRTAIPDHASLSPNGYDDIVVMVPSIEAIEEGFPLLALNGVLNVFAGVARGTMATLDISDVVSKNVRIVGTSGSSIEDMRRTRDLMESERLDTGGSLAAIGGLEAFREGLDAVKGGRFPGKTVIFPQIESLPLTALSDLESVRPRVFAKLNKGQFWTLEAEAELLKEAQQF